MKYLTQLLILIAILLVLSTDAHAKRYRRSYSTNVQSWPASLYQGTDQQRAYAEAKYMHENRIYRHVGGTIGLYEGWGYGGPSCATCTPHVGMTLTADAHYGNIRVRAWR